MEPKFHDGDLIFVDPEAAPISGRYVVVRLEGSHEATFKQLIVEGDRQFLKAVNPDWPQRIIEVVERDDLWGGRIQRRSGLRNLYGPVPFAKVCVPADSKLIAPM